jgi:hypothetical protein
VEGRKPKQNSTRPVDKPAERKAALAYEREQARREREQAKEEAARQKERERCQQAIDKAQAALDKAEEEHAQRVAALRAEIETIKRKLKSEDANWDADEKRLKAALGRARG